MEHWNFDVLILLDVIGPTILNRSIIGIEGFRQQKYTQLNRKCISTGSIVNSIKRTATYLNIFKHLYFLGTHNAH
jgi:hypothetical protein